MATGVGNTLLNLVKLPGNESCAECFRPDPTWAAYPLGVFLCEDCGKFHEILQPRVSGTVDLCKVLPITSKEWNTDEIKVFASNGNAIARNKYERHVPQCYRRPKPGDPVVYFEQWILAKYNRLEFTGSFQPSYLLGHKEGYLWKRGKEDKHFNKRRFVLDFTNNTLRYYNKEGAKEAKAVLQINDITALLAPEKVGHPNGMQLVFEQNDDTRSIYVYSDSGQDLIDWYMSLCNAKLIHLSIAFPSMPFQELEPLLSSEFVKEGWLNKAGPNPNEGFRRRWVSLGKCCLLYYLDPLSAFAKGEVFFNCKDDRYSVTDGIAHQTVPRSFSLHTPGRVFHFSADSDELKMEWMKALKQVISTAVSKPRKRTTAKRKSSILKSIDRVKSFNAQ